ncbi:unnamed protein product [Darwinula stevensoni]|uniref:rRNA adenine N(6)-methyltransferase n=1 Tax=Darwinula stevensoni TaxID=69355 RepID=A0A7R8XEQ3_9CRUS|nr:unnamed protein product [Darwinula stevensoni]CAG0889796.1 unnamed protein product [Darwinula stevensoni]
MYGKLLQICNNTGGGIHTGISLLSLLLLASKEKEIIVFDTMDGTLIREFHMTRNLHPSAIAISEGKVYLLVHDSRTSLCQGIQGTMRILTHEFAIVNSIYRFCGFLVTKRLVKFSAKRGVLSDVSETTENVDAEKIHGKRKVSEPAKRGVKKPRGYESVCEGISDFSLADQNILLAHSHKLMRKIHSPEALYVIQEDVARKWVERIQPFILTERNPIFEVNPGPGILSRNLLKAGVKRLRLFEDEPAFFPSTQRLIEEFGKDRIEVVNENFFALPKRLFQDAEESTMVRFQTFLGGLRQYPWDSTDSALTVIGVYPVHHSPTFLRYLLYIYQMRSVIFQFGKAQLLLCINPNIYKVRRPTEMNLTAGPEDGFIRYRRQSVIFQLFFNVEELEEFPRSAFFPWSYDMQKKSAAKNKRKNFLETDYSHLCLVRITPKKEVPGVPVEQLQELTFFVSHHLQSRTSPIIPALEKWIPGCGPRLIIKGMTIYSRFGDLTPGEILDLYKEFSSWPEYQHSTFRAAVLDQHAQHDSHEDAQGHSADDVQEHGQ